MLMALWLPLIAIIIAGCKKNVSSGPYEVRAYNNGYQFGGIVDGQEFLPQGYSSFWTTIPAITSTYWQPSANGGTERDFYCGFSYYYGGALNGDILNTIEFNIKNFIGVGKYSLTELTPPYGYIARAGTYGGYQIDTSGKGKKYFLTDNFGDSGYVECKRWANQNDFEFYFKYICRNSVVGDPDVSTKTIEGIVSKKT